MVWLGYKLFRAKPFSFDLASKEKASNVTIKQKSVLCLQGISLQTTNPMLIMFFISLFPLMPLYFSRFSLLRSIPDSQKADTLLPVNVSALLLHFIIQVYSVTFTVLQILTEFQLLLVRTLIGKKLHTIFPEWQEMNGILCGV